MSSTPQNTTITAPLTEEIPPPEQEAPAEKNTYGQILKSSALIGGSQVLNIGIGIVRTKVFAVLLGPAGFGLMGLYGSIVDLAQSIAGMGVNSSGVRQIAESVGTGDDERIARTVVVLKKTSVLLGILGAVLLVIFSKQVSNLTFGSNQQTAAVAVLSLAVFFRLVSAGSRSLDPGNAAHRRSRPNGGAERVLRNDYQHPLGVFPTRKGSGTGSSGHCCDDAFLLMVVQPEVTGSATFTDLFPTQTGNRIIIKTRLRIHGQWVSDDGRRLRGPYYNNPQSWS